MTSKLIDAHLHLQDQRISGNLAAIIQDAEDAGVRVMACNAVKEVDWEDVIALSCKYSSIKPFLGIHPWHSDTVTTNWIKRLENKLISTGAGLGEIGFDTICNIDHKTQENVFIQQLELACNLGIPVTIHCIKSWGKMLEILKSYDVSKSGCIIHSFGGSAETMSKLIDLGAHISFSTQLTNPNRKKMTQAFVNAPLDRIFLETDSPDQYCRDLCSTQSCEDNTNVNKPVYLAELYRFAAHLRGLDLKTFTEKIWNNGKIFKN